MVAALMCPLSHNVDGSIPRFGMQSILGLDRVSGVLQRRIGEPEWHFLDNLSAQAREQGICPTHVRILRYAIAATFANGR